MAQETVLTLTGLTKDYGDGRGLAPTDLEVEGGELVMLVGANGAGKSTLLGCCAGLLEPTGGAATVCGTQAGSIPARRLTSYIGDDPTLYDDLSLWEHLEYVAGLHGRDDWLAGAEALLARFRLEARADDLPIGFSRGLKQKAALVLGLVRPFELLLIDEPYVGLDAPAQHAITEEMTALCGAGRAVVVATHQLDVAARATRCVALRDGEIVYDAEPDPKRIWQMVSG